jgi:hypothetical protein
MKFLLKKKVKMSVAIIRFEYTVEEAKAIAKQLGRPGRARRNDIKAWGIKTMRAAASQEVIR